LLKEETEEAYRATEGLMAMVEDKDLNWKPATGENWMTMGQLLQHLTFACGACFKGFATGDWGVPPEDMENMSPDDMLPPAEKLPTTESVKAAQDALAADKKTAFEILAEVGEKRLNNDPAPAPWDPREIPLGQRLLSMVGHLNNHKAQLFYYLKLQGKPVNTMHFYGMGAPSEAK
jgi:hypothetical protein